MGNTFSTSSSYTSLAVYDQIITAMTGQKFNGSTDTIAAVSGATAYFNIIGLVETYRGQTTQFWCLMESTSAVDAYLTTDSSQKYRVLLTATVTNKDLHISNNKYQDYDNVITDLTMTIGTSQQIFTPTGTASASVYTTYPTIMPNTPTVQLWSGLTPYYNQSVDMNLQMTLTSRGFALVTYRTSDINMMPGPSGKYTGNSLVVVQRPVNPSDGTAKVAGTAPIFCLAKSVNDTTTGFKFSVIRESDVSSAIAFVDTSVVSTSVFYKFSSEWPHPNLFDNLTHVIKFPFGFCTTRHIYMEEMDLLCLVNATAFAGSQTMNITMYGESTERTYTTSFGDLVYGGLTVTNSTNSSGSVNSIVSAITEIKGSARIGILTANGGI